MHRKEKEINVLSISNMFFSRERERSCAHVCVCVVSQQQHVLSTLKFLRSSSSYKDAYLNLKSAENLLTCKEFVSSDYKQQKLLS